MKGNEDMSKVQEKFEKFSPYFMKFANSKPVVAMKDGIILTMPLALIGSLFLLLAFVPINGWNGWMTGIFGANWQEPLFQVTGATFDIIALVAVFGIAHAFTKREKCEPISAGVLGIVSFLIVTASYVTDANGDKIGGVIPKVWTGGRGMIAAILVGLAVGYIFTWFMKRDIRIKMPEGVPPGVANAFSALIPGLVIMTLSMLIYILFKVSVGKTFIEWIYVVLQTPIQGLTDSLGGAIAIAMLISLFWWFGIHGATVVMGVMGPICQSNSLANQEIINQGGQLIVGQNAHIVTQQFVDQFITFGGSGMTLGLVIAMLFLAKSSHLKKLSQLSLVPGLFNINEPILFGFTMVLNPMMMIPFILVPVTSAIITYFSIALGFLKPFTAVQIPWTTPPILSGFIVGGWRAAVLQVILIIMAAAIYYPFFKIQDKIYLDQENQN